MTDIHVPDGYLEACQGWFNDQDSMGLNPTREQIFIAGYFRGYGVNSMEPEYRSDLGNWEDVPNYEWYDIEDHGDTLEVLPGEEEFAQMIGQVNEVPDSL